MTEPGRGRGWPRWLATRSRPAAGWFAVTWSVLLVAQVGLLLPDGPEAAREWLLVVGPALLAPLHVATWWYLRRHGSTAASG